MMDDYPDLWIESALYSPTMVRDAVDMAVAVLEGQKIDPVKIIPTSVVDKTNVKDYLDPSSPY